MLGGYPWEGGRISLYLSWIPLIGTVVCGCLLDRMWCKRSARALFWFYMLVLCSVAVSTYRLATVQWWVEVLLLSSFTVVLIRTVRRGELLTWMIYAIFPHAVLGIAQYLTQHVIGSTWFGIASQEPVTPGVSVIESEGRRWLRAYGGFPHPNIFGGWLVFGLSALLLKHRSRADCAVAGLFASAIVLSFSRSAWLSAILLLSVCMYRAFFMSPKHMRVQLWQMCCMIVGSALVTATLVAPLIRLRTGGHGTRLEQKSLDERAQGWKSGLTLFKRHPWMGSGPRTVSRALVTEGIVSLGMPPVPPHNTVLLMLDEIGVVGVFWLILLSGGRPLWLLARAWIFLPILLFDHYPWSTWSGLSLVAFFVLVELSIVIPNDLQKRGVLSLDS